MSNNNRLKPRTRSLYDNSLHSFSDRDRQTLQHEQPPVAAAAEESNRAIPDGMTDDYFGEDGPPPESCAPPIEEEADVGGVAIAGSDFLKTLLAFPSLGRQVAALPVRFAESGLVGDHLSEIVLIEAIRRLETEGGDWLEAIREQLRNLRKDPGELVIYREILSSAADEMLAGGWLEDARDDAPAEVYALRAVQSWLRTQLVDDNADHREAAQLLTAISDLTLGSIEIVEAGEMDVVPDPFPFDLLPPVARELITHAATSKCVDPAMVALPVLIQMASAVGLTRRLAVKPDWLEYPILWGGLIAHTGLLKTPTLSAVQTPMTERQLRLKRDFDLAMHSDNYFSAEAQQIDQPHHPSKLEHVFTTDATMEAVGSMLKTSPRGICIACDELAKWLGVGEYKKNGILADQSRSLELFNGGTWKIDRKTDKETLIIPRAGAWVIGGIQPGILWQAFGDSSEVNGKLARHLLVLPRARTQGWSDHVIPEAVLQRWQRLNENLYHFDFDDEGEPRVVALADAAIPLMRDYTNAIEERIQAETDPKVQAMLRKMTGYAARLALVLHSARQAELDGIDGREWSCGWESLNACDLERGIGLAHWFAKEARRIYSMKAQMKSVGGDIELLNFIRSKGTVSARDLMLFDRRRYPSARAAQEELELLVADGQGRFVLAKPQGRGRPSKRFALNAVEGSGS